MASIKLPLTGLQYSTHQGGYYLGSSEDILLSKEFKKKINGKVQLILTSPPYPLNAKKSYGNLQGEEYLNWIKSLVPIFEDLLTENGSLVVELGNSWEPNRPVQSLLALEALMAFTKAENSKLRLIQQFICYNPSRLPSPAQWVTINPIRTVDSFTHVWWFAKDDYPKANNTKVLRPYSKSMKKLLAKGKYNSGKRPSEHNINATSFLNDRGGSIAHNLFELEPIDLKREVRLPFNTFSFANTSSNDFFHKICKLHNITTHPARMPMELADFFINFLTDENDLILDPFGGSNTTGFCAAKNQRQWISIDASEKYIEQSKLRFEDPIFKE